MKRDKAELRMILVGAIEDLIAATNSILVLAEHHQEIKNDAKSLCEVTDRIIQKLKKIATEDYGLEVLLDNKIKKKMISARFRFYW